MSRADSARSGRGWLRPVLALLTAYLLLDGLRLRERLRSLKTLPDNTLPDNTLPDNTLPDNTLPDNTLPDNTLPGNTLPAREDRTDHPSDGEFVLFTLQGACVDDRTVAAAEAHCEAEGLDVLDLVPAALGSEQAIELAVLVDPTTARDAKLALGRGAFQVIVVRAEVARRAAIEPATGLDPVQMVAAHRELKRYAPATCDMVVAPGLVAGPDDPDQRLARMRALFGMGAPLVLGLTPTAWAVIAAGVVAAPPWGLAALAAWMSQPLVATAGTPIHPSHGVADAALRPVKEPWRLARTVAGRWRPTLAADPVEIRRPAYDEALAQGLDRFFEPRRTDCPLCGSHDLSVRLVTTDLFAHKPGRFTLERCAACGHIFQNPRLSIDGLDFYYRDFYDGLGAEATDSIFASSEDSYRDRAEMLRGHAEPRRWLDVGGGHGHFCLIARDTWPDATFECLDISNSVVEAERRGWVDHGYQGLFPDLAPDLAGTFDVVSMSHYLEHTREPREELAAAHLALGPKGHLLIEVPDPECRFGRLLGRWWIPWYQPQHQHFLSLANLTDELDRAGFDVVACDRGKAHQTVDLTIAVWLRMDALAPPAMPWRPPLQRADRLRRAAVFTLGAPVMVAAVLLDRLLAPWIRFRDRGNTYRVLAHRRG